MQKNIRLLGILLALSVAYFLAARWSLNLAFAGSNASPVWPPTGIAIAALTLYGLRLAPAILIAAFAANLVTFHAGNPELPLSFWIVSAAIAIGNTGEALFAAWWLRRDREFPRLFQSQQSVLRFFLLLVAASAVSAGVGTASLVAAGIVNESIQLTVGLTWWVGDLVGGLVLIPLFVAWQRGCQATRSPQPLAQIARIALPLALTTFVAWLIFGTWLGDPALTRPMLLLVFPLLAWLAWKFGLRGASAGVLAVAIFAVAATTRGLGPFATGVLNESLILLDSFLALLAATALLLTADRAERLREGFANTLREFAPPGIGLLGSLILTVLLWHTLVLDNEERGARRFKLITENVTRHIDDRMHDYQRALRGASGLFAASTHVDRTEWKAYTDTLDLQTALPGVQGLGFSVRVGAGERDGLIRQIQAEGFPNFAIKPDGKRPEYTSIIFLEPFDQRNQRAFGYDMFSEPTRRKAMELARDNGQPSISARVTLLQEDGQDPQPGFLLYHPVYRNGEPVSTPEARQRALLGYVYSPFRAHDLMRGIMGERWPEIWLEVFDGDDTDPARMLYADPALKQTPPHSQYQTEIPLRLFQHGWTLRLRSTPAFDAGIDRQKSQFVFIAGGLVSLLLFAMLRLQSLTGARASKLAKEMTRDLRDTQAAVEQREQFANVLFDTTPEALLLVNSGGRIVRANQAAARVFRYTQAAMLDLQVEDLMPATLRSLHVRLRDTFLAFDEARPMGIGRELVAQRSDGSEFPVEIALASMRFGDEKFVVVSFVDITIFKETEAKIRAVSSLNAAMLDSAAVSIISTDTGGMITSFSSGAETLLGYRADEMVGKQSPAILHLESEVIARAAELLEELGTPIEPGFEVFVARSRRNLPNVHEWTYRHKDGRHFPVLLTVTALRDEEDMIAGFLGVAVDITLQKTAQAAVMEKEHFLQMVTDNLPGLVSYWDRDLRCRFANRTYLDWFGKPPEEVVGLSIEALLGEEIVRPIRHHMTAALAGEPQHFERQILNREGQLITNSTHYIPDVHDGVVHGFFVLATDISELKATQNQLEAINAQLDLRTREAEAASRAKGDFLANMSHEIRTPMNAVIGLSQILLDTALDHTQRDYLGKIQGASQSLLRILNDILDYSKIEAGRLDIESVDFSLADLAQTTIDLFARQAADKSIALSLALAPGLPPVLRGDPLRLGQVLNNLIGNAIKFTEHGEVRLLVDATPRNGDTVQLQVSVADTGIGMTPEQSARLFQPFEQADTSITRKYGGTGLGLSICKRLLTLMDGEISVSSALGVGSTFTFALPLTISSAELPASDSSTPTALFGTSFKGMRVLLVEDNATNQLVAREFLHSLGCQITLASQGQEAVDLVASHDYDLVLMDLQMPVLGGIEATRIIRGSARGQTLPIVAMTAAATNDDQAATLAAGMNGHLAKPIDRAQLLATLARFAPATAGPAAAPNENDEEQAFTLPGLALDQAVLRLGNSWALLRQVLISFHQDFADAAQTLDTALANGDFSNAARLAHMVKGLAPNVGAPALHHAAQQLENELNNGQAGARHEFERALAEVLDAIAPLIKPADGAPVAALHIPDWPTLRAELDALDTMLAKKQGKARALTGKIAEKLAGSIAQTTFAHIHQLVDNLQFSEARAALQSMQSAIPAGVASEENPS